MSINEQQVYGTVHFLGLQLQNVFAIKRFDIGTGIVENILPICLFDISVVRRQIIRLPEAKMYAIIYTPVPAIFN